MLHDLFYGCKCSCGNRYKKDTPITFRRIEALEIKNGLDYLCECLKCRRTFIIEAMRWGVN